MTPPTSEQAPPAKEWILIDLGASEDFNPIIDFLIPKLKKSAAKNLKGKYPIAQTIITHPHDDHLTAIFDYDRLIYPALLTVPNDITHEAQPSGCKVNWKLIDNPSSDLTDKLRAVYKGRIPPLRATDADKSPGFVFNIFFLEPTVCESDEELAKENYTNNLSIISRINYKGKVVLFCGDMMKDGMTKILNTNSDLKNRLEKYGVDFLIAPHHGLRSSFSTDLFNCMNNKKTRGLNIVSERRSYDGTKQIVDSRYSINEYCDSHDVFIDAKKERKRQLKTSAVGHIRIVLFDDGRALVTTGENALDYPSLLG